MPCIALSTLHDITLHYLHYLHYTTLHYITIHYITLRYAMLLCITLQYNTTQDIEVHVHVHVHVRACVCVRLSTCQLGHTLRRPEPGNGVQQGIDRKDEGVACIEQEAVLNEAPWPTGPPMARKKNKPDLHGNKENGTETYSFYNFKLATEKLRRCYQRFESGSREK